MASIEQIRELARRVNPSGNLGHLVHMGCPYFCHGRVSREDRIGVDNLHLDEAVAAHESRGDRSSPGEGHGLHPEADTEDRKAEVQVPAAVAGPLHGGPAPQDDPPASAGYLLRRGRVRHELRRDPHVSEAAEDQVVELPVVVHHIEGAHGRYIGTPVSRSFSVTGHSREEGLPDLFVALPQEGCKEHRASGTDPLFFTSPSQ